jgi:hypothetical protein
VPPPLSLVPVRNEFRTHVYRYHIGDLGVFRQVADVKD